MNVGKVFKTLRAWLDDNTIRTALFYGVLILLIFPLLAAQVRSTDIWKALYSGRYLWWFERFPHHSTFTFSPVRDVITRDASVWLGNLLLYLVYLSGDYLLLQTLRAGVLLLTLVLLHSIADFDLKPSLMLLFVIFAYALDQKLHLRASIVSVPLTVSFIWFWCRASGDRASQWLWCFPPLIVLWSNLHTSYMVGVIYLFVLSAGETLGELFFKQDRVLSLSTLWSVTILSLTGAMVLKPFPDIILVEQFQSLYTSLKAALHRPSVGAFVDILSGGFIKAGAGVDPQTFQGKGGYSSVLEYRHLPLVQYSILFVPLGLAVAGLRRKAVRLSELLLMLIVIPFGLRYTRTVAYLPLTVAPLMLIFLYRETAGVEDSGVRVKPAVTSFVSILLLAGFLVMSAYQFTVGDVSRLTGNPRLQMGYGKHPLFSSNVPDAVLKTHPTEPFLNPWDEGSYLIWSWWPFKKVYVDSKGVPYERKFLRNYDSEWAIRYGFNHVILWRHRQKANFYRRSDRWQIIDQDRSWVAYGVEE